MVSDAFDRADENPIASPWATIRGAGLQLSSHTVFSSGAGDTASAYGDAGLDADQYATVVLGVVMGPGRATGPAIRMSVGTLDNYYGAYATAATKFLFKSVEGAYTVLASAANTWAVDDAIRLEGEGTTIRVLVNGTLDADLGEVTDASLSAGDPGIVGYGTSNGCAAASFVAGNMSGEGDTGNFQILLWE